MCGDIETQGLRREEPVAEEEVAHKPDWTFVRLAVGAVPIADVNVPPWRLLDPVLEDALEPGELGLVLAVEHVEECWPNGPPGSRSPNSLPNDLTHFVDVKLRDPMDLCNIETFAEEQDSDVAPFELLGYAKPMKSCACAE